MQISRTHRCGVVLSLVLSLVLGTLHQTAHAANRLASESSPYLRMHANNPVDWYPWGAAALAKAKKENKVIFLSVGYSSCYWCHVMERESFMDDEIAKYLNENFVCIKVDREERPDLDSIYMTAVQLITGRGGWPMSVFLTPDTKPFFGGTYFPARDGDRGTSTGFLTLVKRINAVWKGKNEGLREYADQLTSRIRSNLNAKVAPSREVNLDAALLTRIQQGLAEQFDPQYGGFGFDPGNPTRPKFPEASNLLFLLHRARGGNAEARKMVEVSLEKMHRGGIWDHVGGGFHRYSVDRFWHIPHFEKMLYDNGQLATVYTEAYELTKRPDYRRVVQRTLDFVLREMRDTQGAFYSALDAESEHVEGKFYRWELAEVKKALSDQYNVFAALYGLNGPPNFEHRFHVPQLAQPLAKSAARQGTTDQALWSKLRPLHQKLLTIRNKRPRPLTDTKILASWNGLMIRGFADVGRALNQPEYIEAAGSAADFVLTKMRRADGRLFRTHTGGKAKLNAYLDDYAFLCDGLIALHKATGNSKWLTSAEQLTRIQIELFSDEKAGGFYFTSSDHESLIARGKQPTDGAQPAGNSVAAQNLIYLGVQLQNAQYLKLARSSIASTVPLMARSPRIAPRMALALAELLAAENE